MATNTTTTPLETHLHNLPWEDNFGYSQIVVAGNTAYFSGQFAHAADGTLVGEGDIATQVKAAFDNIDVCLAKIGATRNQIVNTNVLIVDLPTNIATVSAAHAAYFESHRPASTVWGVTALYSSHMMVEIQVTVRLDVPK